MGIYFEKISTSLLMIYKPSYYYESVNRRLQEGELRLKNTFYLKKENISNEISVSEEEFCFKIGELKNDYYLLDKNIFFTNHNFYIESSLKIEHKMFISYQKISILQRIDEIIDCDIFITPNNDGISGHIPFREYMILVESFPNYTEVRKYTWLRISQTINNYVDNLGDIRQNYELYLSKRSNIKRKSGIEGLKSIQLNLFEQAYHTLNDMMENSDGYLERDWQLPVRDVLCVLYPKYILAKREVDIGSDGRHRKKPDFILVDSSGFVDVLEIKKPTNQKLITNSVYRNNYVADRDLSGAIIQIEKYIYTLNHGGTKLEADIKKQLLNDLPEEIDVRITNPQGILLMGRSIDLSPEQRFDMEIIKRQHKNIVDIMTYDDLLWRLGNIIERLKNI